MSAAINNGGPAFPNEEGANFFGRSGMTLRDYFAAKVINGILCGIGVTDGHYKIAEMADMSYRIADAMLRAREAS